MGASANEEPPPAKQNSQTKKEESIYIGGKDHKMILLSIKGFPVAESGEVLDF